VVLLRKSFPQNYNLQTAAELSYKGFPRRQAATDPGPHLRAVLFVRLQYLPAGRLALSKNNKVRTGQTTNGHCCSMFSLRTLMRDARGGKPYRTVRAGDSGLVEAGQPAVNLERARRKRSAPPSFARCWHDLPEASRGRARTQALLN
jgi:hypothetical protein